MHLQIIPAPRNTYPLLAVLLRGNTAPQWVQAIQTMGLSLDQVTVYPLPDQQPNSVWGCLVALHALQPHLDTGKHNPCQQVSPFLFIPDRSSLFPQLHATEIEKLCGSKPHLFHPEIGLVELPPPIQWSQWLVQPLRAEVAFYRPAPPVAVPQQTHRFLVCPIQPQSILEDWAKEVMPDSQPLEDQPLSAWEKSKLFFLRQLFKKSNPDDKTANPDNQTNDPEAIRKTGLLAGLESLRKLFTPDQEGQWSQRMQAEYEALENRSKQTLERLLDMLNKDPELALKYAIPLDEQGASRGNKTAGNIEWMERFRDLSLGLNIPRSGNSGGTMPNDYFQQLQAKYLQTALQLVKEHKYQKAAFVYLRLLKNPTMAAQTLEQGKHYQEAAAIYLRFLHNKEKAAYCYEQANLILNAVELYKELGRDEKVGDLYMLLSKKEEAIPYYKRVVATYIKENQYVKAALLCREKMQDPLAAQDLLLDGWRKNIDAFNCLNNYFVNLAPDEQALGKAIHQVYAQDTNLSNRWLFLRVLQQEYDKHPALNPAIRQLAYEIVVQLLPSNLSIASELHVFNKKDRILPKDAVRYRLYKRK